MIVAVHLFAAARQLVAAPVVELSIPDQATFADLRLALVNSHPALATLLSHSRFAMDAEYVGDDQVVRSDREIACIPPVSGG